MLNKFTQLSVQQVILRSSFVDCRGGNSWNVRDVVPRSLELRVLAVLKLVVLNAVAVHHRKAVEVSFLGDGAGFGGLTFVWAATVKPNEHSNPAIIDFRTSSFIWRDRP